jgi:hypothetical protein
MGRYWIFRDERGLNKIKFPSKGDLENYSGISEDTFDLGKKAEFCAALVKLEHPEYSDERLIYAAGNLMHNDVSFLKRRFSDLKAI